MCVLLPLFRILWVCLLFVVETKTTQWDDPRLQKLSGPVSDART